MPKSILIIDDEVGITDEVKSFLNEEGFHALSAYSARDGLDLLGKNKIDLMILDMKLPDISGVEVLRICKEMSPRTKIMVITGYVDQNTFDEAEKIGYDGFLQKPFDFENILEEISRVLGLGPKPIG